MQVEFNGNDGRVSLIGEFTFTDHGAFRDIIKRLIGAPDQKIVLDLSKLEFIDSAGLGMLLIARDEAKKVSRTLTLSRPQAQVERMLSVTKLDSLFAIEA